MSAEANAVALTTVESAEPTGLAYVAGFFFSFRIFIVFFSVRALGADPRTGAEWSLALDFLLLLLVCFQSLGRVNHTFSSMRRLPSVAWVLAFLAFSGCSLAWSGTVSLPASSAYWCGLVGDVAIVVLLLRAGSVAAVASSLMKGFIVSACCIALIAWILPADPNDLRFGDEEFFNTNQIGNLCAVAILLAQYLTRRKEGKWGWLTLFLAVTLLRSLSKTTIVAFLASEIFLLIRDGSMSRKTKLLITVCALLAASAFWGLFESYFDIYTTTGNQAETLTGRTAIWAYVLAASLDHPLIGHGFDAMWKVIPPFGPDRFEVRHAENEWLQQFYAYGMAGLILLLGLYGSLFRRIRRIRVEPLKVVFLSILIYVLVRGIAEAEPFDLLLPLWLIVVLSMAIESAKNDQGIHAPSAGAVQHGKLRGSALETDSAKKLSGA